MKSNSKSSILRQWNENLIKTSGGGGQRDGGLFGDVPLRPHRHDIQGPEQSKQFPGDLL